MAVTGAIADRVRGIMPVSFDMLTSSATFGDGAMRTLIDTVKTKVMGENLSPVAEATYSLIVIDYLAKLAALELINPAIDAWRNEPVVVGATGTNEQVTYTDAVTALTALREDLLRQTKRDWATVGPLITYRPLNGGPRPLSNTINEDFLTPSPQEFPRPYRVTERT